VFGLVLAPVGASKELKTLWLRSTAPVCGIDEIDAGDFGCTGPAGAGDEGVADCRLAIQARYL